MPNPKLQAKIKIAQKQLGLEDPVYRDILYRKFRVSSSKSLSDSQALVLIYYFQNLGWKPKSKPKKYDDLGKRDVYAPSPAMLRKLEVLFHDICYSDDKTLALRRFLFKRFKVSDVIFLDSETCSKTIEAVKAIRARQFGATEDSHDIL